MDWTAEQVHELTKDWPAEAKLRGAYYTPNDGGHICDREGLKMLVDTAVHGYVGSGLAWLVQQSGTRSVTHTDSDNAITKWCVYDNVTGRMRWGEELLHAVASAVLAAKGGGDA